MKTHKQIICDTTDEIHDISHLLWLGIDSLANIEHDGEDIKINGLAILLSNITDKLENISSELRLSVEQPNL